jgi:hypothetical protein
MTGISNRPEDVEDAGQQRVEARKDQLPEADTVNRLRKDHPADKDRATSADEAGRVAETGAGRGPEHQGH